MVLPLVLVALDKNDWRTKVQSSQMLGQMAYCAPKVLATYLPQIIPYLPELLNGIKSILIDPIPEVQSASALAIRSLNESLGSTLILIGDLLNGMAGNEGSVCYDTNETAQTENRILECLGSERRNEVFSLLYMARSETESEYYMERIGV